MYFEEDNVIPKDSVNILIMLDDGSIFPQEHTIYINKYSRYNPNSSETMEEFLSHETRTFLPVVKKHSKKSSSFIAININRILYILEKRETASPSVHQQELLISFKNNVTIRGHICLSSTKTTQDRIIDYFNEESKFLTIITSDNNKAHINKELIVKYREEFSKTPKADALKESIIHTDRIKKN